MPDPQPSGTAPSAVSAPTLRTNDFDELAERFTAWDATFRQMSGGAFSGSLTAQPVGAIRVSRLTVSHALQLRGVLRRPGYIFTPVLADSARAVWRGSGLSPGQVNLVGPETYIDHLSAPAADYSLVAVDHDRLREFGLVCGGFDPGEYLSGRLALSPTPHTFRQFLDRVRALLAAPLAPTEIAGAEAELFGQIVQLIVSSDPALEEAPPIERRLRVAQRAEEFMLANLARPLTVFAVCRELGVSERTLQYAFRERFGMGPKTYLKVHRLNAVRRALKAADPATATVHAVAGRWGFTHTGEFAADYRRHFGELPSETLARG